MQPTKLTRVPLYAIVLDREHEVLIGNIALLENALALGRGADAVPGILKELSEDGVFRFAGEDRLMRRIRYPGRDRHTRQHHSLRSRLQQLTEMTRNGEILVALQLLNFMREWLSGHVAISDMQLGAFLHAREVNTRG